MKSIVKKLLVLALILVSVNVFAVGPTVGGDVELVISDPVVMSIRQLYVTGSGNISTTLSIETMGTHYIELVSIRLHLSDVGGANNFTLTQDSALGSEYDTVLFSQDMTAVTDIYKTYVPGEAIFDNNDDLKFAWTNGSTRTYGLEVLYRQR